MEVKGAVVVITGSTKIINVIVSAFIIGIVVIIGIFIIVDDHGGSYVTTTGSAQGIGRSVAEHLLAEGAKVKQSDS